MPSKSKPGVQDIVREDELRPGTSAIARHGLLRSLLVSLLSVLGLALGPVAAAAGASATSAVSLVPPSANPPASVGTLSPSHGVLVFSGEVDNPTPLPVVGPPMPAACASECKEFQFTTATTQPFLVAIKNTVTGPNGTFNPNDGFDLYLYGPDGALVGQANGIGANGQSLTVSRAVLGTYTIVVSVAYAEDPKAAYTGEVRLMTSPWWSPPPPTCGITVGGKNGCFELPDLRALPPYDLTTAGLPPAPSSPLGFPFPTTVSTPTSCYADESLSLENPSPATLAQPALRCLRFTSDVQDLGAGALEVRLPWLSTGGSQGGPASGFVPGQCQAQQVVLTSSGQQVTRPAGPCEFHPAHAHFHYKDLVSYSLHRLDTSGGIGAPVAKSQKESFCLADDDYFGFATPGPNGPRTYVGQPGCNVPSNLQPSGGSENSYVVEGITPGWGDVYTWDTPDQYVDVTTVPPGTYDLVEETNPDGVLLVAGSAKTCAVTQLQLTANSVKTISSQSSVTCPA